MANIAMLLQEYYPKDVRVRKEAAALLEAGHAIDIFCLQGKDEKTHEELNGISIHRVNLSKKRSSKFRYIYEYVVFFFAARKWLKKLLHTKRIDIVHVHTLPDFLVFAAKPARKNGARIILDMHEITPEFFMSKYGINENNFAIKLLKTAERKSLQYADYVITINKQLKDIFMSRAKIKNDVTVIMNTVNDATLPRLPKEKQEKFTAVYHGTISQLYNLNFTVNALAKIKPELDNFEFHVYGGGAQLEELKSLVRNVSLEKTVFVHGYVSHTEIPGILSKADLGILPIRKDVMTNLSFSNKLAEYVHCCIPVLSSDLVCLMEYFPAGTIHYYKSDDENDFCRELLQIMSNYNQSKANAERAFEIGKAISWDVMKARLQKLTMSVS